MKREAIANRKQQIENPDSASHTAATCTVASHDHFGQIDAWHNGHADYEPMPDSDELVCGDCHERMYYDTADDRYHHLETPERGCFLIPAEIDGVFQRVTTQLDLSSSRPQVKPRR